VTSPNRKRRGRRDHESVLLPRVEDLQPGGRNALEKLVPSFAAIRIAPGEPCLHHFRVTGQPFAMNSVSVRGSADPGSTNVHLLAHFFVLAPEFRIFRNQTRSDLAIHPPQIKLIPSRIDTNQGKGNARNRRGKLDSVLRRDELIWHRSALENLSCKKLPPISSSGVGSVPNAHPFETGEERL
jgi:hypothetical protein